MKVLNLVSLLVAWQLTVTYAIAGSVVYKNDISFLEPESGSPGQYALLSDVFGHHTLITGTPAQPGDTPSIITLDGGYESISLGESFELASVTYTNGVNWSGSLLASIPIQVGFLLTDSHGFCGWPLSELVDVTFNLGINSTPNNFGDAYFDADSLSIFGETSHYFTAFGTTYRLELLGFGNGGCNNSPDFIVPEGATQVMGLYARLTTHCVPEPSAFVLCGIGSLGFVGLVLQRRRPWAR